MSTNGSNVLLSPMGRASSKTSMLLLMTGEIPFSEKLCRVWNRSGKNA